MVKIKSKLKETDFSKFNLRDAYITDYPDYAARLRDEAIFSNYGIKALIKTPKIENNVDEYSNFVDDDFDVTTEVIVPKFEQYRQNVSVEGMSADGTEGLYPLEVLIPTKLHLPKNSRIVLTEYNSNEYIIAREWTVLSTEMKQLSGSKTYTRVAYCVPARQTIHRTMEFENVFGIFYFDISNVSISKNDKIRANTCFYFKVTPASFRKDLYEEIQEDIQDIPEQYNPISKDLLIDEDTLVISDDDGIIEVNMPSPGNKEIQEVFNNIEDPIEWQENLISQTDVSNVKLLHTNSESIASFVTNSITISVLY